MVLGIQTELILRVICRAVHLLSTMTMLTILVLENFFQLERHSVL